MPSARLKYGRTSAYDQPASPNWTPPVLTCSGLTGDGLADLWEQVELHRSKFEGSGERAERRQSQQLAWMDAMLREQLLARFEEDPTVMAQRAQVEAAVLAGEITPSIAVERLLED